MRSCKTCTFGQPPLWHNPSLSTSQNKGLSVHSPEFCCVICDCLGNPASLGPAINIFQHNKSLYCPTISHAFCQDRQMNELPGGKFGYKFTRPLLHHNCLYSYSHSSCSSRCTWKWFVLRKKRGWLVCICSVETKERMSWGFLRRRWHPGRSPTNLPGMCPSFCGIHHVYSTLLGNV